MNICPIYALVLLCHVLLSLPTASAQVYEKLYDFTAARTEDNATSLNKGGNPSAGLVQGRNGNFYFCFYGASQNGGPLNYGAVLKMTADGAVTTLVQFTGNGPTNKGSYPSCELVTGSDGSLYGTTSAGGANDYGTVFRMTPAGVLTTLVEFTGNGGGNKGRGPDAGLVQGSDGNFYGTTARGGVNDYGTVFRMTPAGVLTTLVEFTGNGGSNKGRGPHAGLVQGSDGNFYGTTASVFDVGENTYGTVFKVTPNGVLTTLVEFTGNGATNKGSNPIAGLVQGGDGNFYGTTYAGGTNDYGTVFKMTSTGMLTTLVEFTGNGETNKGSYLYASLVQGSDGNFYGTTASGGANDNGTVFKVTPAGVLTTLIEFTGNGVTNRGSIPYAGLTQGSDGSFYGTTYVGGANDYGTVFRTTPAGALTTLVEFTGNGVTNKGSIPYAGLVHGSDGSFYGTTYVGGANDYGTIFKMTPAGVLTTLVEFTGNRVTNKGKNPYAGLVQGNDGNLYGSTVYGGANDYGTVFKVTLAGVLTTLVEFTGNGATNKGTNPYADLLQATDGNFYGTTASGGLNDYGTVFRMTPDGVLTTLVEFTGNGASNKGSAPGGGLVQSSDGDFYGTTSDGGANGYGTAFRMTSGGVLTTLVEFTGTGETNKGSYPSAGLVQGSDGDFYGTTGGDGVNDYGTVFRMTSTGVLTTMVEFTGNGVTNKGSGPAGGLFQGSDGNFYGTTASGGTNGNGTVFRMTPAGALTTLVEFTDGSGSPAARLIRGTDGNLYGSDTAGEGSIYRLLFPGAPLIVITKGALSSGASTIFEAQLNARGATTVVSLEYGTDGASFPTIVPLTVGLSGYQTRLVGTTLSGLPPGMTFFYRIRAVSSAGTTVSPVASFSTLAEPMVTVSPASAIEATSAQFNGMVNARNFDSTALFEWGTDGNSFPNSVSATPGTVTGNTPVPVSAAVAGLPEGGTVFFRVHATNAAGTVISGVSSFSTVSATTTAAAQADVGVTEATLKASVNTYGRTALVKFRYWAENTPADVKETASQTVFSNSPTEVTAHVTGLAENVKYDYQVSVEIGGVPTDGSVASLTTQTNRAPVAVGDLVFYSGQVVIDPLANDMDPNDGTNANLLLAPTLVVVPNASKGVASVTGDRRFISYNPQFNVLDDDVLTYRVVDDPLYPARGLSATAQARLVAFSKRAGLYGGTIRFGSGAGERVGPVALQMGGGGAISTSFFNWGGESFALKGVFDQHGSFTRTLNSPTGAVLTITLTLDADLPRIVGSFEERVGATVTASVPNFVLKKNAGTGGLAESGLRTGFLNAPSTVASAMGDGFLRMTVGKDTRRGARFAGRLPDGEPFLASVPAQGRSYALTKPLEQGGVITGLVRAIDAAGASGLMGDLFWKKRANSRARFERGGVEMVLSLSGVAYPAVARGQVPPIGFGAGNPNARLRMSGGDLAGTYRDLLLNVLPGSVQIIGPDLAQSGADIPMSKLQLKMDAAQAKFTGRFLHPATGKTVPFEGGFRMPFDTEPGQGRGIFRGPSAAGSVRIEPN